MSETLDPQFYYLCRMVARRLRNDLDMCMAITGFPGYGKSTLGYWLLRGISHYTKKRWNLIDNFSYVPAGAEIVKQFNQLPQYSVYVIDEAVRSLHKHNWQNAVQQSIIKMYNLERWQNKCTIVIMPRFRDFTESFRNFRITIWVHIIARGRAIVFIRDDDKDEKDPWHLDENLKLKQKTFKRKDIVSRTPEETLEYERKTKNYLLDFTFPDMPEPDKTQYKELKIASRTGNTTDIETTPGQLKLAEKYKQELVDWKERTLAVMNYYGMNLKMPDLERIYKESRANLKEDVAFARQTIGDCLGNRIGDIQKGRVRTERGVILPILIPYDRTKPFEIVGHADLTSEIHAYLDKRNKENEIQATVLPTSM